LHPFTIYLSRTLFGERRKRLGASREAGRFPRRESVANQPSLGAASCPYLVSARHGHLPLLPFLCPSWARKNVSGREAFWLASRTGLHSDWVCFVHRPHPVPTKSVAHSASVLKTCLKSIHGIHPGHCDSMESYTRDHCHVVGMAWWGFLSRMEKSCRGVYRVCRTAPGLGAGIHAMLHRLYMALVVRAKKGVWVCQLAR